MRYICCDALERSQASWTAVEMVGGRPVEVYGKWRGAMGGGACLVALQSGRKHREQVVVCVCDLVFNIPLYAAQTGYDSGSAEGGGASSLPPFFPKKHPDRPALPVIVIDIYKKYA